MMREGTEGEVRFRVRYSETDQMGVVYHANYLIWCEIGRTELMRSLGYAYADVEATGIKLAVAEASVRYGQAASYDDAIVVRTRIVAAQSRTITFAYEVLREAHGGASTARLDPPERLATAITKLIAIDDGGAPRRLPGELLEVFRNHANPD
jgi:acyl-CoA thioester hydrolase